MQEQLKNELYDVISGKSQVRYGAVIQSITSYLGKSSQPGSKIENPKQFKEQEEEKLRVYILEDLHDENVLTRNNVLYFIDTVFYLTEEFWKK